MARKFIFADEPEQEASKFSYQDGFRFGFGFFIALLSGSIIVFVAGWIIAWLFKLV